MIKIVLIFLFLVSANGARKIPIYSVNLNLPPEERWKDIVQKEMDGLREIISSLKSLTAKSYISGPLWWIISNAVGYGAAQSWDKEYFRELEGISQAADISVSDLAVGQLWYEFTTYGNVAYAQACTSIIARDKKGNLYHGRNLDYNFTEMMRRTLIFVNFIKDNKVLFSTLTWPGYTGSMTGQRPGAFSISQNTRVDGTLFDTLQAFWSTNMANPHSFAMRHALEKLDTYEEAVDYLSSVKFMAPGYFIIAGTKPDQGVVLSRNRLDNADSWDIGSGLPHGKPWYLLETNFDHWEPPQDKRRETGISAMNKESQFNMSPESILRVLSTPPVLKNDTLFSTVMSAAKPELMYETAVIRET